MKEATKFHIPRILYHIGGPGNLLNVRNHAII